MKANPAETVVIGTIVLAGVIQFLRCRRDFSLVFYETVFLGIAVIGATRIAGPLQESIRVPALFGFVIPLLVFAMVAIILATLFNRVLEFDLGRASWFFGLILALVCGLLAAHSVLRAVMDGYGPRRPEFGEAIARSWLSDQLYHCTMLKSLLAKLGIGRLN